MPKKSRRTRAKYRVTNKSPKESIKNVVEHKNQDVESKQAIPTIQSISSVRSTGHGYVLPELRRIGIIAGFLVLVIIALTFILN